MAMVKGEGWWQDGGICLGTGRDDGGLLSRREQHFALHEEAVGAFGGGMQVRADAAAASAHVERFKVHHFAASRSLVTWTAEPGWLVSDFGSSV